MINSTLGAAFARDDLRRPVRSESLALRLMTPPNSSVLGSGRTFRQSWSCRSVNRCWVRRRVVGRHGIGRRGSCIAANWTLNRSWALQEAVTTSSCSLPGQMPLFRADERSPSAKVRGSHSRPHSRAVPPTRSRLALVTMTCSCCRLRCREWISNDPTKPDRASAVETSSVVRIEDARTI